MGAKPAIPVTAAKCRLISDFDDDMPEAAGKHGAAERWRAGRLSRYAAMIAAIFAMPAKRIRLLILHDLCCYFMMMMKRAHFG